MIKQRNIGDWLRPKSPKTIEITNRTEAMISLSSSTQETQMVTVQLSSQLNRFLPRTQSLAHQPIWD